MSNGAPYPYEPPPRDRRHTTPGASRTAAPRRRSRARNLVPLGVAAWGVLEVWLLSLVADAAGGLTVLALLVAGLLLGGFLVRRAGRRAWRQLSSTLSTAAGQQASAPAGRTGKRGGNTLAMLGGLLLMVPGLVSDAAGLLCLFPPTAALLRRAAERKLATADLGDAMRQARGAEEQFRIRRPDGRVVPGEVVRDEDGPDRR
jgi:UPF0716 protein FxsA